MAKQGPNVRGERAEMKDYKKWPLAKKLRAQQTLDSAMRLFLQKHPNKGTTKTFTTIRLKYEGKNDVPLALADAEGRPGLDRVYDLALIGLSWHDTETVEGPCPGKKLVIDNYEHRFRRPLSDGDWGALNTALAARPDDTLLLHHGAGEELRWLHDQGRETVDTHNMIFKQEWPELKPSAPDENNRWSWGGDFLGYAFQAPYKHSADGDVVWMAKFIDSMIRCFKAVKSSGGGAAGGGGGGAAVGDEVINVDGLWRVTHIDDQVHWSLVWDAGDQAS